MTTRIYFAPDYKHILMLHISILGQLNSGGNFFFLFINLSGITLFQSAMVLVTVFNLFNHFNSCFYLILHNNVSV